MTVSGNTFPGSELPGAPPVENIRTLVDLVEFRGADTPDKLGFTFLKDGEEEIANLTFGELARRARAAGATLRARGAEGQRVLLLYPQGLEFIVAFFACHFAGATAVPAPAANAGRAVKARIQGIVADAQPAIALTLPDLLGNARDILRDEDGAQTVPSAALEDLEVQAILQPKVV